MFERFEVETFLTLSDELHFSRTAERLRVTPGRISQTIKKLERQIGSPLFERTSRRVALTPLGHRLRDDLLPAYQQIRIAFDTAAAIGHGIHGVLRVGFTAAWAGNLILRATDPFRTRHPGCTIELREVTYGAVREVLRTGELDLVLAEVALVEGESEFVIGPTVFSRPQVLAVPAAHPLAEQTSLSVEDLATVPLIIVDGIPEADLDSHLPRHTPAGRPISRGPAAAGWQEMLTLVGRGKGATPACDWAADYYARPDVAFVPFAGTAPIDQAMIWSRARETAAIRLFTQTVTDSASALPGGTLSTGRG
ncbi:LysR family transcriptional regulator [Nocardia sp. NPDC057030]|uniref:LysR family transcriptional regulator n=1 Tax=unclassified Nocardia TaxID=2637762 RepID=UPI00363AAD28